MQPITAGKAVAGAVIVLMLAVLLTLLWHRIQESTFYSQEAPRWSQSIDQLERSAVVGETKRIAVQMGDAECVAYVTPYTSAEAIVRLMGRPTGLGKEIERMACDDHGSWLLWIKDDHIVAAREVPSRVGLQSMVWWGENEVLVDVQKQVDAGGQTSLHFRQAR